MTETEREMWQTMEFCNGEIRVKPGRYGGGFIAAGCATVEWEFDDVFDDLTMGDNDYFNARDFFGRHELAFVEGASSARDAFEICVNQLCEIVVRSIEDNI